MTIEAELPRLAAGSTRDHVLLANTALVDRVDLATPLSLSSQPATGLSALAPAQRAGAQRLCALARLRHADRCRKMSVCRGRPEVIGVRSKRRFCPWHKV